MSSGMIAGNHNNYRKNVLHLYQLGPFLPTDMSIDTGTWIIDHIS